MTDDPADLEAWIKAGVYDPDAPDAEDRLALLQFFKEKRVPLEEIQRQHALGYIDRAAADHFLRVERSLTVEQVGALCGLDADHVERAWLALGYPAVPTGEPGYSERDVPMLVSFAFAKELFGVDAALQFTRVMGTSLARIADAAVSTFMVNVEDPLRSSRGRDVDIARAGVEGLEGLVLLPQMFTQMFHRHIEAALFQSRAREPGSGDVFRLAVGFVDLVGYTAWSESLSFADLAAAMSYFEGTASEHASVRGARVVKLIGDAVMFVAADPSAACDTALDIIDAVERHPVLTSARGAIAFGELLSRDGDYFGPIVNLAARALKVPEPGQLVATQDVTTSLHLRSIGVHPLRGVAAATELFVVTR